MSHAKRTRDPALDVVRCTALLTVVTVHFFLNCGYYYSPVVGIRMYVMTVIRTASMICIPLFLLLSGYLLRNKKPSKEYYLTLLRTLGIYILASIACGLYRIFVLKTEMTFRDLASSFLTYQLAQYGWYIEMYIGLFLLIPYLNILYHALGSQRSKQQLLITLLFLTAASGITNFLKDLPFLPEWWDQIYPLTYYFIGCYLREYPLRLKPTATAAALLTAFLAAGTWNYILSYGVVFDFGIWQGWGSAINVVMGVLAFHFLTSLDYSRMPLFLTRCFARISDLSLGAYLVSWIFDRTYYPILAARVPDMHMRLAYLPVMVIAVYFSSLALSAVLHWIYTSTLGRLVAHGAKTS